MASTSKKIINNIIIILEIFRGLYFEYQAVRIV